MATTKVILNFPWTKNKDHDVKAAKIKDPISELAQKVAKSELREDKETREQSLKQLREWILKNYDIENVRTDDSFLLRFLRCKKFSIPMAQQQILKYLNMRRVMNHLIFNLDFLEPGVKALIDNGYIMTSPIRDKFNRRTLLYFARKFFFFNLIIVIIVATCCNGNYKTNIKPELDCAFGDFIIKCSFEFLHTDGLNGIEYKYEDQVKAHIICMETVIESEEEQILGVVHIGNFEGANRDHVSVWRNPIELLKLLKWGEQSLPLRHKEIHIYNVSTILKYVVDAGKGIVSNKIKNRAFVSLN
jgi:CRAL/TRIO domain